MIFCANTPAELLLNINHDLSFKWCASQFNLNRFFAFLMPKNKRLIEYPWEPCRARLSLTADIQFGSDMVLKPAATRLVPLMGLVRLVEKRKVLSPKMTATSSSSTSPKKSAKQKQRPKHSSIIASDESKSLIPTNASSDINAEIAQAVNQYLVRAGFTTSASVLQDECKRRRIPISDLINDMSAAFDFDASHSDAEADGQLLELLHKAQSKSHINSEQAIGSSEVHKDYRNLQKDYHRVVDIASQLINCLEQLSMGNPIPPHLLASISKRLSGSTEAKSKQYRRMEENREPISSPVPDRASHNTSKNDKKAKPSGRKAITARSPNPKGSSDDLHCIIAPSEPSLLNRSDSMGNILIPADPSHSSGKTRQHIHTISQGNVVSTTTSVGATNAKIATGSAFHKSQSTNNNFKTFLVPSAADVPISNPSLAINVTNLKNTHKALNLHPTHKYTNSTLSRQPIQHKLKSDTLVDNVTMDFPLEIPSPPSPVAENLNYTKISNHLVMNPTTRSSTLLLQALRQQLTRAASLDVSDSYLQRFASKDILSLRNRKNSVVATILTQTEPAPETKEELGRLLNTIASFKTGRKYLMSIGQGKEMLYQVALALRTKRLIGFAADHSLAALQKLSIRSVVQKELILSGMIEWLLLTYLDGAIQTAGGAISSNQRPTNFGTEYGIALLMNLCLNNVVSQSTVIRYKDQLLTLLSQLLTSKNIQTIPYVTGTLYCLLGAHSRIRQAARERDLETILTNQMSKAPNLEVQREIGVVLGVLRGELEYDRKKRAAEDEDEEYEDYLEAEIDSTDTLIPCLNELFGEALLRRKYSNSKVTDSEPVPQGVLKSLKEVEEESVPGTVPTRRAAISVPAPSARSRRSPLPPTKRRTPTHSNSATNQQQRRRQPNHKHISQKSAPNNASRTNIHNSHGPNLGPRQQTIADFGNEEPSPLRMVRFQEQGLNRSNSMMSHTTFVLENSKRIPLLVPCGFKEAVVTYTVKGANKRETNSTECYSIVINEKSHAPSVPTEATPMMSNIKVGARSTVISKSTPKSSRKHHLHRAHRAVIHRQPWKDVDISNEEYDIYLTEVLKEEEKTDMDLPSFALDAESKIAHTRIPEDADIHEYASIFGSRPKVIRTPDNYNQSVDTASQNQQEPHRLNTTHY
ncbi:lisH domain-containing protein ARMC9 [Ditylenchus destructor]|nr:lisH domain-containing protein ARMC9 [Ditylenchus destructor]